MAKAEANAIEDRHNEPDRVYEPIDPPKDFEFDALGFADEDELIDAVAHRNEVVDETEDEYAECLDGDADLSADGEAADAAVDNSEVVEHGQHEREPVYQQRAVEDEVEEVGVSRIIAPSLLVDRVDDVGQY